MRACVFIYIYIYIYPCMSIHYNIRMQKCNTSTRTIQPEPFLFSVSHSSHLVHWCNTTISFQRTSPVATDKAPERHCILPSQAASHCSDKRTELSEPLHIQRARIKTPLCQIKTTTITRTELRVLVDCTDHFVLFASWTRCLFNN